MGASAFLCPDSSAQPLESLQPCQQWQRAPLPARLPALVGAKWALALFFLSGFLIKNQIGSKILKRKEHAEAMVKWKDIRISGSG